MWLVAEVAPFSLLYSFGPYYTGEGETATSATWATHPGEARAGFEDIHPVPVQKGHSTERRNPWMINVLDSPTETVP